MSNHRNDTPDLRDALVKHHLATGAPSQLSDAFRAGYWAAIAAEREACAKVCDEISSDYCTRELRRFAELRTDAEIGAGECAAEIRSRGAKGGE